MGYEVDQIGYTLFTGKDIGAQEKINIKAELDKTRQQKFDFMVTPIFPKNCVRTKDKFELHSSAYIKTDMQIQNWKQIVIRCSELDLDCEDEEQRKLNKFLLKQEIGYAAYLGVYAIILPYPKSPKCGNYLRTLQKQVKNYGFAGCQIWLSVPLVANDKHDTWEMYQSIKQCLDLKEKLLGVNLIVRSNLPSQNIIDRWMGESIRGVELSSQLFQTNTKGMPILAQQHEMALAGFFKFQPNFIVSPKNSDSSLDKEYRNYLCYVFGKQKKMNEEQMIACDYYDVLQNPLQPYKHNLEAGTYQVFESDQPKYNLYEEAVYQALMDKSADSKTIVYLVGAGRAPILKRIIAAADRSKRNVFVYAIEKNPYAISTIKYLQERHAASWQGRVELVAKDMKIYTPEHKADIIVSELLGSFGDNELSPECLEWAQQYLNKDGISIPKSYTSFMTPVSCQSIYDRCEKKDVTYLVYLNNKYYTSKIQPCFKFTHPNENQKFKQFKNLTYEFTESNYVHGFAGFFESELYGNVLMSINPDTHTPDMLSWFPVFFPFDKPLYVEKTDSMVINVWRKATVSQIWYEWSYEIYGQNEKNFPKLRSQIFNLEGKGCNVLL